MCFRILARSARSLTLRVAFLSGVVAASAAAQSASVVRQGSYEIGGMLGASYGIDKFRIMGGGNVTFAATRVILPYFEYTYFPGLGRQLETVAAGTNRPVQYTFEVPLSDVHAGVHIRIPIAESRVVPYLVAGFGVIHSPERLVDAEFSIAQGGTDTIQLTAPSDTTPAVNAGGGLRFYVNQRFGLRVEAKAYKPVGDYTAFPGVGSPESAVFGKVVGGIFFQIR